MPILLVGIVIAFGILMTEWCSSFLCEYWGQVLRGDSYAELGQYESGIQEYDEVIRLEQGSYGYYQKGLAYEALGKTIEAERDFAKAKELGYDP